MKRTFPVALLSATLISRPDSLRLYPAEHTIDLMYGELVVQSVSEADALWRSTPRDSLAREYRARMVQAVARYRAARDGSQSTLPAGAARPA